MVLFVIVLKILLNIEVIYVIFLKKTNVSENFLNSYTKKILLKKYHDFIKNSKTTKNIMTSAKIQPFCKKYNINLGVYNINQQEILPRYVTERRLCLIIHENHFCVIWKTKNTSFTNAIKELEDDFKYEDNQISDNILKQVKNINFLYQTKKIVYMPYLLLTLKQLTLIINIIVFHMLPVVIILIV